MYDPSTILTWLEEKVQMRQSRRKTLAAVAGGTGVGGRSMPSLPPSVRIFLCLAPVSS